MRIPYVDTWTGPGEIVQPNFSFVFSDNIEDWIKGKILFSRPRQKEV